MDKSVKTINESGFKHGKTKKVFDRIFCYFMFAVLIIYCITLILPLIWMILTSCKSYIEFYDNMFGFPIEWDFSNFRTAIEKINSMTTIQNGKIIKHNILNMAGVSLVWAAGGSLIFVFFTTLVAYVMSRYRFKGNGIIYFVGIFVMITPLYGSGVSLMTVRRAMGIYDNLLLMIITNYSTIFSGLYFMLMYAAFKRLPWSYAEAAFIDGAGNYKVMFSVMIPMMLPTCAVIFVLSFLASWNDYATFLTWLPSYPNLSYGMYKFQTDFALYGGTINEIMAGLTIVMIPSVILFLSCQKLVVSKFTVGGLKG